MKIVCPQCAFERQVPDDRLPSTSVIATCPQCQHRFRVQRQQQEEAVDTSPVQHGSPRGPEEDDPLPPGALIPRHEEEHKPEAPEQYTQREEKAAPWRPAPRPAAQDDKDTPPRNTEEEREYRREAAAAYERQAEEGGQPFALENPWEHPERDGYLASFYQTVMRVMFAAPRFFAGLQPDSPQMRAMIFYLIVSVLQICIERFWGGVLSSVLAPTATNDPQLQKLLQMLSPESNIILAIFMRAALVTLEIFIMAGLYFLIFKLLAPRQASYSLIFQVLTYSVAPALLCIVPVAGSVVGFIWSVACSFVGCRYAMGLSWTQTALGLVPIYVMAIPIILQLVHSIQTMAT